MPPTSPPPGSVPSGGPPSQPPSPASIWLRLALDPRTNPEVYLRGLEVWLELGLLSDAEVRLQCGQLLTCQLNLAPKANLRQPPVVPVAATPAASQPATPRSSALPPADSQVMAVSAENASAATSRESGVEDANQSATQSTPLDALGTTLAAEFSLNWLLALGVFVVVVSSGALAASQWQQVSNLGQYAILWAYTLAFFGVGLWLGRSEKLRLTGQMVRAMALFLVPINGWAIDGLRLWNSAAGWGLVAVASLSLIGLSWLTMKVQPSGRGDASPVARADVPWLVQGCALVLGGLQWGWGLAGWPLAATYIGALLASIGFWSSEGLWPHINAVPVLDEAEDGLDGQESGEVNDRSNQSDRGPSQTVSDGQLVSSPNILGRSLLAVGIALLLARAAIDPRIAFVQLGLAIGMFGWQLGWIARSRLRPQPWLVAATALFVLGWQLTVGEVPVQALGISALAAWIAADRVRRLWAIPDVLILFGLIFQAQILVWLSIPDGLRQGMWTLALRWFSDANLEVAVAGLGLCPAVGLAVWGADWLRQRNKPHLALGLERVALGVAGLLALLAIWNPGVRALYFVVSTAVLAVLVWRRTPASRGMVYLTHSMGVLTLLWVVDAVAPGIGVTGWGAIAVGLAVLEWGGVGFASQFSLWRRSGWYIGIGLGVASYSAFLGHLLYRLSTDVAGQEVWGIVWLAVPVASAIVSQRRPMSLRLPPIAVTIVGLVAGQLLTVETLETQLAGWVIAATVMGWLTYVRPSVLRASLAVGFALFGMAVAFAELPPSVPELSAWMFAIAVVVLVLWSGRLWTARRPVSHRGQLGAVTGTALYGWGIGLAALNWLFLIAYTAGLYLDGLTATGLQIGAAWLMVVAMTICAIQRLGWLETMGLVVAVELAVASTLAAWTTDVLPLATANVALGLLVQVGEDLWVQRAGCAYTKGSLVVPTVYAGWGFVLSLGALRPYSGLYALGLALVLMGLGRRDSSQSARVWTVAGLLALTVALYQTTIYQLLQASGGSSGDGVAVLGGLAIAIAAVYQALPNRASRFLRLSADMLAGMEIVHWCAGSLLLLLAWFAPSSDIGHWIWIGSAVGAATVAIVRGRAEDSRPVRQVTGLEPGDASATDHQAIARQQGADEFLVDKWTYAGIAWGAVAVAYSLVWIAPESTPVAYWGGGIAAAICAVVLLCPWQAWGWSTRPWHRSATVLPALVVGITLGSVGWQSLLIVAAYYAWVAIRLGRIRIGYWAVLFADIGLLELLDSVGWLDSFWFLLIVAGSGLYAAQVDPVWSGSDKRDARHWVRCFFTAMVCLTVSIELEAATGLAIAGMVVGLAIALVGLLLRVRAYLYVGTGAFAILLLRQTWMAIMTSSVALWSVGIVLGLGLIWIAATFEARRDSTVRQLQGWSVALQEWD